MQVVVSIHMSKKHIRYKMYCGSFSITSHYKYRDIPRNIHYVIRWLRTNLIPKDTHFERVIISANLTADQIKRLHKITVPKQRFYLVN